MRSGIQTIFLKFRSRIYVGLLFIIGASSFLFIPACNNGGNSEEADKKAENLIEPKQGDDSLRMNAKTAPDLKLQDTIYYHTRKSDTSKKVPDEKQKYMPGKIEIGYGVPQNYQVKPH
jgi:hypothetical protein